MELKNPEIPFKTDINLNGVNIRVLSQERKWFTGIHPEIKANINAEETKAVVLEYMGRDMVQSTESIPLIGKALNKIFLGMETWAKLEDQLTLLQLCKEAQKPVVLVDVANRPTFLISQSSIPTILFVGYQTLRPYYPEASGICALAYYSLFMTLLATYQEGRGKGGHFNKKAIRWHEKLLLSAADTRRVFIAEGIRQKAKEFRNEENHQIVVCYPEAHARRIAHYLKDPTKLDLLSRKAKQFLYRTNFWLDFNVRTYNWDEDIANSSKNPEIDGWQLVSPSL